jgi:hypothetical protein
MITKSLMVTNSPCRIGNAIENVRMSWEADSSWIVPMKRAGTYDDTVVLDLGTVADGDRFDDTVLAYRDEVAHLHLKVIERPLCRNLSIP